MISQFGCNHLPFSHRKRILATGGDGLLRMQQPDSTMISEPSFKEKSFSCDASSVMSSSSFVPVDSKKPQISRSSVISVDYDSDHFDSLINVKPVLSKHSKSVYVENESVCDSPSTHSLRNSSFNFSKKTSTDLDGSDLFFSPKKPETVQTKSKTPATITAADDIEPDDFYIDDFDIDDFNDSDIPDYYDEPSTSSLSNTVTTTVKEGGPSKSSWEKKPTTPVSAPKPSNVCSPGKHGVEKSGLNWSQIFRAMHFCFCFLLFSDIL